MSENGLGAHNGRMSSSVPPCSSHSSLASTIANHPLFKGLPSSQIAKLQEVAMWMDFKKDELILREGDPANRFYLIVEGKVAVEKQQEEHDPVLLQIIGADDVLGWSWLFPPYYWNFDARACEPTRAIFFYGTWLREHCEADKDFGYEMMKRMAQVLIHRLQATRKNMTPGLKHPIPAP